MEKVKHRVPNLSVSTPKLPLFPLQQLSLPEMLAKVILGERLLDLQKYNNLY